MTGSRERWVVPKKDAPIIAAILTLLSSVIAQKSLIAFVKKRNNTTKQTIVIPKNKTLGSSSFVLDYQELVKHPTDVMLRRNNSWSTICQISCTRNGKIC
ncbi:MAG: hypothetical protein IPL09_00040 [Bacteroidetes bacterium]|nr:hypothetical protein [Bacteroidota bacterium]